MLKIFKNKKQKEQFVTSYENPFKLDKIKKIEFVIEKSFWTNDKIRYKSMIMFDTGNTTAYQNMEAASFIENVEQTEKFIQSL